MRTERLVVERPHQPHRTVGHAPQTRVAAPRLIGPRTAVDPAAGLPQPPHLSRQAALLPRTAGTAHPGLLIDCHGVIAAATVGQSHRHRKVRALLVLGQRMGVAPVRPKHHLPKAGLAARLRTQSAGIPRPEQDGRSHGTNSRLTRVHQNLRSIATQTLNVERGGGRNILSKHRAALYLCRVAPTDPPAQV